MRSSVFDLLKHLAPIFVMSYVALVGYGLVNLFLAIMTQSYDRLRQMYFDDYVQNEAEKKKMHEKSVGTSLNDTKSKKKKNDNHMSMTAWQAATSLVPLFKDVKTKLKKII